MVARPRLRVGAASMNDCIACLTTSNRWGPSEQRRCPPRDQAGTPETAWRSGRCRAEQPSRHAIDKPARRSGRDTGTYERNDLAPGKEVMISVIEPRYMNATKSINRPPPADFQQAPHGTTPRPLRPAAACPRTYPPSRPAATHSRRWRAAPGNRDDAVSTARLKSRGESTSYHDGIRVT